MKKILYVIFCCLFMTAVFTGCGGNEKSASGAAKHLNLGLYWFGESMDPAHEWDGWTMVRIGAGETLVTVTDKMEFNLTCKKSPPSIGGEMNCGFFCGFDALRKTIAL